MNSNSSLEDLKFLSWYHHSELKKRSIAVFFYQSSRSTRSLPSNAMPNCAYCTQFILFGGVKEEGLTYCNHDCQAAGLVMNVASQVPSVVVSEQILAIRRGNCPKCGGPGPVDLHTSHIINSYIIVTSWGSRFELSCQRCGVKKRLWSTLHCMLMGWWGVYGLIMTPIQIMRNLGGLFRPAKLEVTTPQLEQMIRVNIAQQALIDQSRQSAKG
jgi:hypothetical protein